MSNGYIKHRVTISGDTLIMHNGQLADPSNKYARALKEVSSDRTRKRTDEGILAMGNIELEGGLYLDAKGRVIVPSRVLEASIVEGAKKTKGGKNALAGMFVDTDGVLDYAGGPLGVKELIESPDHRLTVGVVVGQVRVMRVRPFFKDWSTSFEVSVLEEIAGTNTLKTWLTNAGSFIGLGDWRPRYGRFEVDSVTVLKGKK